MAVDMFIKIDTVDYVPQDHKGAPGTAIPMPWDIATNVSK
jgi:hypothetical protein